MLARIVTILLSLGFVAHAAAADSLGTFYNPNFAKTPLLDGDTEKPEKSEEKPDEAKVEDDVQNKLLAEYGDPAIDPPINVVDNAPKPFKAMMAAMESGDDDTAFKYARQYVRYLRNLNERTTKVMGFTKYAMQSEGMADSKGAVAPRYEQYRPTYTKDQGEKVAGAQDVRQLDDRTKAMLARAEIEEDEAPSKVGSVTPPVAPVDEKTERVKIRAAHQARVPVDPAGRADVYFFFRPRDSESGKMFTEIEQLYKVIRTNPKVKFSALSLDTMSPEEMKAVRFRTGATFPIKNGAGMAKKLGVSKSPSTVIISPGTSKGLFEEGYRRGFYLDELIKMMQGK